VSCFFRTVAGEEKEREVTNKKKTRLGKRWTANTVSPEERKKEELRGGRQATRILRLPLA